MKRTIALLLALAMSVGLASCGLAADGVYTASAAGFDSDVTVTLTIAGDAITDVTVDASGETAAIGGAAAQTLADQVKAAGGAEIDGVSGATLTSTAVKVAVADALAQANGGAAEKKPVADGVFSGTAESFGLTGMMTCEVTFAGGAIESVSVVAQTDSATGEWFASAEALLIPRLVEAQSLAVDAVAGATVSSNAIKSCVAAAIDAAGGDSTQWYTPTEKKTDVVTLEGYDVIVVGMGGSGVFSYCAAADQGATVFGIETAGKIGGNSVCTYGPMALNSQYLKDKYNGGEDYINADDVYAVWMDYVGSDEKADVIREAVYNSGSALDYFVENFGFEFEGLGMLGSFAVPEWTKLWTVYSADNGNTSWNILGPNKTFQFTRALDIANAKNEKNRYMTELTATTLIFDEAGKAIGVNAEYWDGTRYEIYGDAIILATGGFLGNDEMMTEYLGTPVNTIGVTTCDGTGINMGISAGGATYMMKTLPMVHISQVPHIIRNDDLTADQKAILSALALTTDQLMVTIEGNVWGNANQSGTVDEGISVEIVFAPGYRYYVMYTQEQIDAIRTAGLSPAQAAASSMFMGQGGTLPEAGTPVADIDTILAVGEAYGNVTKAESIAELAQKLGCDEANLTAALGTDTTWYAVGCNSYAYATVGGLDVDANMNVLREDGTPIENLFAVGQDSEGVCNVDGKAYTPWGGQAQSWTFVSGEIAGKQAAAYALAQ